MFACTSPDISIDPPSNEEALGAEATLEAYEMSAGTAAELVPEVRVGKALARHAQGQPHAAVPETVV
jgi:hypothetical protein